MIVISDTSPLNYLVLVGQVDILPALFERVAAPPAVVDELLHLDAPPTVREWARSPPKWLEILSPTNIDRMLPLGSGEVEAICLAQEIGADVVLIDERTAAVIARQLGLKVAGTLGVLEMAAERRLIDLPAIIAALRQTTFRAAEDLYEELLRRERERRQGPQESATDYP